MSKRSSPRCAADEEGGRVEAAEVSVLLRVEESPETPRGWESGLEEKAPPRRVDSAARESLVMPPGPSWTRSCLAAGSVVFYALFMLGQSPPR